MFFLSTINYQLLTSSAPYASSSIGRAAVSKAAGYRFDSCLACSRRGGISPEASVARWRKS